MNWSKTGRTAAGKWTGMFSIPGFPTVRKLSDFLENRAAQFAAFTIHQAAMQEQIAIRGLDYYVDHEIAGTPMTSDRPVVYDPSRRCRRRPASASDARPRKSQGCKWDLAVGLCKARRVTDPACRPEGGSSRPLNSVLPQSPFLFELTGCDSHFDRCRGFTLPASPKRIILPYKPLSSGQLNSRAFA